MSADMIVDFPIAVGVILAGLVSFLSPCVLPLVPPYLAYLGGTTIEQMGAQSANVQSTGLQSTGLQSTGLQSTGAKSQDRRIILAALCFVAGFTTVFVCLGAGASAFGQLVQAYKHGLSVAAGLVIIAFGLHFLGLLRVPFLYKQFSIQTDMRGASYAGAYTIGMAFAFGWTPCIGPVLATVLTLAANENSLKAGITLLFLYSLGLGIPFVLAAMAVRPFLSAFKQFRAHLGRVEKVMGAALVLTGLLFLTGSMGVVGQWLIDNVPALARLEEWVTPKGLGGAILKKGAG